MRVVVVGGGVLGTMHAWQALRRGHEVVQLEREPEARGASVRNFGLIWISGRAEGEELAVALRGRELWAEIAADVPGLGFRPAGSLTLCRTGAELAMAPGPRPSCPRRPTASSSCSTPAAVRRRNPALAGDHLGGLWSGRDAVVEPRTARSGRSGCSCWPGPATASCPDARYARSTTSSVRDDHGDTHPADVVFVCPGATLAGLVRELAPDLPVRRVRLQMMQTAPLDTELTTAVADGDSLRYYPAFDQATLARTQPQDPLAREHGMQLLMVQRLDGGLTIGDTHAYAEPFDFDVEESPVRPPGPGGREPARPASAADRAALGRGVRADRRSDPGRASRAGERRACGW